ncbi:MAG: hypothetical protein JWN14_2871, partial [Chthonomonadales bacterium]|nr:hypothetical protein [Chthonomonadales bacterium]
MFLNPTTRDGRRLRPALLRHSRLLMPLLACVGVFLSQAFCRADGDGLLGTLAKPIDGRSMRASSTFREGPDGKYDSKAFPKGDQEEKSNFDNFRVDPGKTHVLMDVKGPGVITHMWFTFLGPEIQQWAKEGSANHQ